MVKNVKSILFSAIGSLVGLAIGSIVENKLNDTFNPELQEEKDAVKETLLKAMNQTFEVGEEEEKEETSE
jgi:hypothetical protein